MDWFSVMVFTGIWNEEEARAKGAENAKVQKKLET